MAYQAKVTVVPIWWAPSGQEDDETPLRFRIKPLTGMQVVEVMSGGAPNLGKTIQYGLVNWENFQDENGRELKFKIKHLEKLPADILSELAAEIISISNLTEDDAKN